MACVLARRVRETDGLISDHVLTLGAHSSQKQIYARLVVFDRCIRFQVDTGTTCNVLREADLPLDVQITRPGKVLSFYDGTTAKAVGTCKVPVENPANGRTYSLEFQVLPKGVVPILGAAR